MINQLLINKFNYETNREDVNDRINDNAQVLKMLMTE